MNKPMVSICCQTYNHKNYIKQSIEGFLMQKANFKFEVLLRDDASTDGTLEIVKEYSEKYPDIINPLIYEENQYQKGISPFRDNVKRAKSKYIAICEGDDYWTDPLKLQKQVDFLEANPEFSFCFHNVNKIDENDLLINTGKYNKVNYYDQNDIFNIHVHTVSLVFRNNIEIDNELFANVPHGDALLVALLATKGKAADLGFVGANYRLHSQGAYCGKSITV